MSLVPDKRFKTYLDLTPDFLISQGITSLLIDIDNTLAPYEQPDHDEHHKAWFESMASAGVHCFLISNNHSDRVERFAAGLGVPAEADCSKPWGKKLPGIVAENGIDPAHSAVLGDQIFTDVATARRLGMRAFIVPPIRDKRTIFFRLKRLLEVPIMKKYDKIHGEEK